MHPLYGKFVRHRSTRQTHQQFARTRMTSYTRMTSRMTYDVIRVYAHVRVREFVRVRACTACRLRHPESAEQRHAQG